MKFSLPLRPDFAIVFRHPTAQEDEHGNIIRGIINGVHLYRSNESIDHTTFTPIK